MAGGDEEAERREPIVEAGEGDVAGGAEDAGREGAAEADATAGDEEGEADGALLLELVLGAELMATASASRTGRYRKRRT